MHLPPPANDQIGLAARPIYALPFLAIAAMSIVYFGHLTRETGSAISSAPFLIAAFFIIAQFCISAGLAKKRERLIRQDKTSFAETRIDCLTGLANRKALMDLLADHSEEIDPSVPYSFLVILDLDRFKSINDGFGHQAGDALLKMLGGRLVAIGRDFDCRPFRLGGDEFALVIERRTLEAAKEICLAVRDSIVRPYKTSDFHAFVGCSLGVAKIERKLGASDVLRRADLAMYRAKKSTDSIALFDAAMLEAVERNADLSNRLRHALQNEVGLSAKLQMILARNKEMVSLEALFRWSDEKHGSVCADEAIEIARTNHLLDEISTFMVRSSIEPLRKFPGARLCLNVEATQLLDERFSIALLELVQSHAIETSRIQLEIRESDFVEFGEQMSCVLQKLHYSGFVIAVDNFGSSNASLTYLRKLGATELKFDQSVLENARETQNNSVMKAKVELAKSLGLCVTCKGIADEEDELIALATGCDYLQGFRYCRPDSSQIFTEFSGRPELKLIA